MPAIFGIAALLIGLALLKRGRWPRRIGQTAHCPKCDYILAGDLTRCPECGTPVNSRNVVRGERPRREGLAWAGALVALLGVALLALRATDYSITIDWIRYKPLSWLIRGLGNATPSVSTPAWNEIQRRLTDNGLSDADQNALVDRALAIQASGTRPPGNPSAMLDYVGGRYLDHKLNSAQSEKFFAGMLRVALSVRPVVGTRSRVPYVITGTGVGPSNWWLITRALEARVDDGPVHRLGGGAGGSFGGWSTGSTLDPVTAPGKHHLHVKVELATDVNRGGGVDWDDKAAVAKRVTQDLAADFQTIEGQTPIATVTTLNASVPGPLLNASLMLKPSLRRDAANPTQVWLNIDAAAAPVDLAFEVFLRFNGKEFPAGSVSYRAGAGGGYGTDARDIPLGSPPTVDVIFRSSEEIARQTINMTRIWKGQIIVPNVPLPPPLSAPATSQPAH